MVSDDGQWIDEDGIKSKRGNSEIETSEEEVRGERRKD